MTTAQIDETGENRIELEYIDGTTTVKTQTFPDGGKLSYGYDSYGNVTAITQSTAEGESNSTEIKYTLGYPTKLQSGNNTVFYEYDHKRRKTKVTVNGKETKYEYAENVNAPRININNIDFPSVTADMAKTTANGATAEVYTDRRGNVVRTKVNDNVTTAFEYDADNRLIKSGDNETKNVITYAYRNDGTNNLDSVKERRGATDLLTENYTYDDYGKVSARAITGAVSQTYTYDYKNNAARDLESIGLPNELKSYPQTDVNGRNTGKELKNAANNNVYAEYIYYRKVGDHGTNMPSSIYFGKNKNGAFAISDNIKYKYDKAGNISEVKENGILTVRYTYDTLGRLVREDNRKLNKTNIWSYDVNGNILSKRETSFTLKPTDEIASFTDEKLYAYDGDRLLAFGDKTVFYDGYGRPASYFGKALEWINGSRLKSFGDTSFLYDGYGRRIKKNATVFTYDANNRLVKQTDGNKTLAFIYDNGGLSGVTYYDGVSTEDVEYIYCKDVQANIVGLLDKDGNVVVQYSYDAWGNCQTDVLDEAHAEIAELNPFRYRSYYLDIETNLYYLQTRYYDPEVGRFISQDDVSYLDPEHVNGLNLFAYCGNNPVMGYDPDGTFALTSFLIGIAIAVSIGAIVGAASYTVSTAVTAAFTGEWNWSWGMFIGSTIGGAIGGALSFALPGLGIAGSAAITGGLSTLIGMGLSNAMGESNYSFIEIMVYSILSAGISALAAGITQYIKIPGFTGRGSISAVARNATTRLFNGTMKHIAAKTFEKMLCYELVYSVLSTVAVGIIGILQFLFQPKEANYEGLIITGA